MRPAGLAHACLEMSPVITIGLLVAPAMGPFAGDRPSRISRFDGID